jgi:hypothetical protein
MALYLLLGELKRSQLLQIVHNGGDGKLLQISVLVIRQEWKIILLNKTIKMSELAFFAHFFVVDSLRIVKSFTKVKSVSKFPSLKTQTRHFMPL